MSGPEHERFEILLVKAVDEVITPQERRELEAHIQGCERCREELEDFIQIKRTTDSMTSRILADVAIEPPRERAGARAALGLGFFLLLAGALLLLGFAGYTFLADAAVPLAIKVGTSGLGLGVLVLLIYVLRIRARALKRDPYKEIDQ
jgi:anti-sigma factor RsiW